MFRRKDEIEPKMADTTPVENVSPAFTRSAAAPAETATVAAPVTATAPQENDVQPVFKPNARPTEPSKPYAADRAFRPAEPVRRADDPRQAAAPVRASERDRSTAKRVMTVGQDTALRGEISGCDRVIVEGDVDANLSEVQMIEISDTGSFKGSAIVEEAEISGVFDGDLTVKNRLLIYSTGRVNGKVRYGEIEIQRGGQIAGEVSQYLYDHYQEVDETPRQPAAAGKRTAKNQATSQEEGEFDERPNSISELFAN